MRWRHKLPVKSVVVLLRPEALSSGTTGRFADPGDAEALIDFRYRLVRVWELSPEVLLAGGLGTLPLAPIGQVARKNLPAVIEKMDSRLNELNRSEAADARTSAYVLLGLRYPAEVGRQLLQGVRQMKESATYQAIVEEGLAEGIAKGLEKGIEQGETRGKVAGERDSILRLGKRVLGEPDLTSKARLSAIQNVDALNMILDRLLDAKDWQSLLEGIA